jgi:hypothetical protein
MQYISTVLRTSVLLPKTEVSIFYSRLLYTLGRAYHVPRAIGIATPYSRDPSEQSQGRSVVHGTIDAPLPSIT